MKKFVTICLLASALIATKSFAQQDKSKRPSPPAKVTQTTETGATISIDYSQPSLNGRTLGVDIAPFGKVWRTGANEATVFEVDKDVMVQGQPLKAGKYSLYSIPGQEEATIIFNKTWKQWGTVYKEEEDALRIKVYPSQSPEFNEKMTFNIDKSGKVTFLWGQGMADFMVK